MLTKLTIRNFKRFPDVEIELGSPVAFIGPNNSGKTSAMQALALWDIGAKRWNERRAGRSPSGRGRGITINRRDLVAIPVPNARLLWRDLHVRDSRMVNGKQRNQNIRMDIEVEGVTKGKSWNCGLEFDYANEESIYCRPLRISDDKTPAWQPFPPEAAEVRIAFLPPMSGLTATETRLDRGAVHVRVGEGRTAEVLRNLCHSLYESHLGELREHEVIQRIVTADGTYSEDQRRSIRNPPQTDWRKLVRHIRELFGVELQPPQYIVERGEISMSYVDNGVELDLSASGRGLQQTMLILAFMYANPGAVLMLDEPDAHLEILRQRQIYGLITEVARESGNQIIAASHSEVILNDTAENGTLIAFVGNPHRVNDRGSQVLKALNEIGFEHYYQAEQTGWVLYLEGSTDLVILKKFADRLAHEDAKHALERPYVHYVGNQAVTVRRYFPGLRDALPCLQGVALFDRFPGGEPETSLVKCLVWRRREIENYLSTKATLENYVTHTATTETLGPMFDAAAANHRLQVMNEAIDEVEQAAVTFEKPSPWSVDAKASDDLLAPFFRAYFRRLDLPNIMNKNDYSMLVDYIPDHEIDHEVTEKLDAIAEIAARAEPRTE